ncbi:trihelix transcription factor ASR3-like [Wolffia australiana]
MSDQSLPAVILLPDRHRSQGSPSAEPPLQVSVAAASPPREYRKGNWTLHETLVLIAAKRLDDDRRSRGGAAAPKAGGDSAEPRWKWIADYCWRHRCFRSQNQCNDRWDNLLRGYKKVQQHEASGASSYWEMEREERKKRNLPSNLSREIFDAVGGTLGRRVSLGRAAALLRALAAREERRGKRHLELVALEERRVRSAQSGAELLRRALDRLAGAVDALVSSRHG